MGFGTQNTSIKKSAASAALLILMAFAVGLGAFQDGRFQPEAAYAACGDGVIDGGDICDDGNAVSGDGCSSSCLVESGFSCSGIPSVCTLQAPITDVYVAVCGNGIVEGLLEGVEQCDNGKNCSNGAVCTADIDCAGIGDNLCKPRGGDGCSATCQNETGGGGGSYQPPPIQPVSISQITAFPEQRSGATGTNYDTRFHFLILHRDTRQALYSHPILLTTTNAGTLTLPIPLELEVGQYDVTIKTVAHLRLILDNVQLKQGENAINFTKADNSPGAGPLRLMAGDINGLGIDPASLGDNVINAVDLSVLLKAFGKSDPTGNSERANLNQDTVVNETDLTILLGNLDKAGD